MHEHDPNLPATFGCRMWGLQLAAIDREPKGSHHGDGQNYQASFKDPLHAGTEFDLFEQRGGWLRIKLADDSDCWIPGTAADLI